MLVVVEFSAIMVFYGSVQGELLWIQLTTFKVVTIEEITSSLVVLTDVFLASSLVFLLLRLRSGVKRTDSVVKRLVVYIISTSLITSLVACLALTAAIVFPKTFLWICFVHLLCQCTCFFLINDGDMLTRIPSGYVNCMFVLYVLLILEAIDTIYHWIY